MSSYRKFGIPLQSGLIQRPHLLASLQPASNHRVMMLSAPAGCGKTSLATQLAYDIDQNVVWHTVSFYQRDIRQFYARLLDSLSAILPDIESLLAVIQQSPEQFAHEIASYLNEYLTEPLFLFIDDWQTLDTPYADRWLKSFVALMPQSCRVGILSRTVPALDMVRLIARKEILNVPQQDLYFTEAEVYMLATRMNTQLHKADVETIWKHMRGWPAGTILAFQPMSTLLPASNTEQIEPSEALFQSIASEMLAQQLPHIQHFLKWTSTSDYFNAEVCEEVYNLTDWQTTLAEVIQKNLFISQHAQGYQYHQLFRTFLQTHFRLTQTEQYLSAHRRLGAWYQSQMQPDRAVHHYILGDHVDQAVDLIESLVYSYYIQGRIETIRQYSDLLQSYEKEMPHLDHIQSKIYISYERDLNKALFHVERSIAYFEEHDQLQDKLKVLMTKANILQAQGNHTDACCIFERVLAEEDLSPYIAGDALNDLGMSQYYLGEFDQALALLEQARPIIEDSGGVYSVAKIYSELELVHRSVGNVDQANLYLEKQVSLWRKLDNPEPLAMALNNLGYRYYEQGHYDLAYKTYEQGLETITNLQYVRSEYYLHASLGDLERDRGRFANARDHYQRALNLARESDPYVCSEVLASLSMLYRWQNKIEAALTCAQDSIQLAQRNRLQQRYLIARIAEWHVRLQPWSIDGILREMKQELVDESLRNAIYVEWQTLQFRIAVMQSNIPAIRDILVQIQKRYERDESVQPFFAEIIHNNELSIAWQTASRQFHQLSQAVRKRELLNTSENRVIPITPTTHNLRLFTLGKEKIRRNNQYINLTEWMGDLGREFLYYFVFNGVSTRDAVAFVFWPDKSEEASRDNFHQTLARVRGGLGNDIIIFNELEGTYFINPDIQLWCDALQLDSLVKDATRLSHFNHQSYDLWHQATQLTYGDFLPTFDREWITIRREYYHKLTVQAWMGLGDNYRIHHDYLSAISAYEKIDKLMPYYEASYRARMECFDALGERSRIFAIYQNLTQRLSKELGTQPSQQTQQLFARLTSTA